jgi:hypothetical protein
MCTVNFKVLTGSPDGVVAPDRCDSDDLGQGACEGPRAVGDKYYIPAGRNTVKLHHPGPLASRRSWPEAPLMHAPLQYLGGNVFHLVE